MIEVPLSQGLVALIDDEDAELVLGGQKWSAVRPARSKTAYAFRTIERRHTQFMHRLLLGLGKGQSRVLVDHRDRNGLNNQRSNLRIATASENVHNAVKSPASSYRGVTRNANGSCWTARIQRAGVYRRIGSSFKTAADAARAYDAAAREIWGEFAVLNFQESNHST